MDHVAALKEIKRLRKRITELERENAMLKGECGENLTKCSSNSTLFDIPFEILFEILDYLDAEDILKFCVICKRFAALLRDDRTWKFISDHDTCNQTPPTRIRDKSWKKYYKRMWRSSGAPYIKHHSNFYFWSEKRQLYKRRVGDKIYVLSHWSILPNYREKEIACYYFDIIVVNDSHKCDEETNTMILTPQFDWYREISFNIDCIPVVSYVSGKNFIIIQDDFPKPSSYKNKVETANDYIRNHLPENYPPLPSYSSHPLLLEKYSIKIVSANYNIETLPQEIIYVIVERVSDVEDILSFCRTCKQFAGLFRADSFCRFMLGKVLKPEDFDPPIGYTPPERWSSVWKKVSQFHGEIYYIYARNGDDIYIYNLEENLYISKHRHVLIQICYDNRPTYLGIDYEADNISSKIAEHWESGQYDPKTLTMDISEEFRESRHYLRENVYYHIKKDNLQYAKIFGYCRIYPYKKLDLIDLSDILPEHIKKEINKILEKCYFMFNVIEPHAFTYGPIKPTT